MNIIDNYNKNIGRMSYTSNSNVINQPEKNSNEQLKSSSNIDNIEIKETNENVINKKKAYDALRDTCDEIGPTTWNGYTSADMITNFLIMADIMKTQGIPTPNFVINGNDVECSDFVGFVDKLKNFANSALQNNEITSLPTNFMEFCDKYKENLIKYGCK